MPLQETENENDPLEKLQFPLGKILWKNPISPWRNHLEKMVPFPNGKNPLNKFNFPLEKSFVKILQKNQNFLLEMPFGKIPCNKPSVKSPLEKILKDKLRMEKYKPTGKFKTDRENSNKAGIIIFEM